MFHALMLAARADSFIKRVVIAHRAEFHPVILPEAGDRGRVEDDL